MFFLEKRKFTSGSPSRGVLNWRKSDYSPKYFLFGDSQRGGGSRQEASLGLTSWILVMMSKCWLISFTGRFIRESLQVVGLIGLPWHSSCTLLKGHTCFEGETVVVLVIRQRAQALGEHSSGITRGGRAGSFIAERNDTSGGVL